MTIVAKYAATCSKCGKKIAPGERIEWTKGQPVEHTECPTPAQTAPAPSFPATPEQQNALALFATGRNLAIEAGAGTGKTTTLRLLAESTPRRGQYIAFNRAIVLESKSKFPSTVRCDTAHSLAFQAVVRGTEFADRLRQSRRMRSLEIANRLGIDSYKLDEKTISAAFLGGLVMASVTRFCQTADLEPDTKHVPYIEGIDHMVDGVRAYHNNDRIRRYLKPFVRAAWADLSKPTGSLPFKHDHYLKMWQLSDPRINADYILFDEAQDANPVMVAVVAAQTHAQLVWVGDSQQQIYTFTGAVNALQQVPADDRAFLTQSFRFGHAVAGVANDVLDRLAAELRIVGTSTIPSRVEITIEPNAILARTNATAVRTVMDLQTTGKRVALVGGGDDVVRFAKAARDLQSLGSTEHPDLACFDSWSEVRSYVEEDEQGGELRLLVKLVDDFGIDAILAALDRVMREDEADVIVSTAHKAKGREWDRVQLASDFPPEAPSDEELRLLYVACTRAKLVLDIEAVDVLRQGTSTEVPEEEVA